LTLDLDLDRREAELKSSASMPSAKAAGDESVGLNPAAGAGLS
jgi:hypothetical protein